MGVMKCNGDTAQSTPCSQHPLHTQPCECWSQLCHNTKGYFPTAQHQCCSEPLEDGFGVEDGNSAVLPWTLPLLVGCSCSGHRGVLQGEQLQSGGTPTCCHPRERAGRELAAAGGLRGSDQLSGWGQNLQHRGEQQEVGTSSSHSLHPMGTCIRLSFPISIMEQFGACSSSLGL